MSEPIPEPSADEIDAWHRTMGARLFNRTWELLDLDQRTSEQEDEMLAAALGQRFHWYQVGTPVNRAIADWQASRVMAVLGFVELAERFGNRSLAVCEKHDLSPFYTGYAHEAIARAADVMDDHITRDQHLDHARQQAARVTDPEERAMLEADIELVCG